VAHLDLRHAHTQSISHDLGERCIRALAMRGDASTGRHDPGWRDVYLGAFDAMTAIGPRGFHDRGQANANEWRT
jgi:hypothetical protein